MTPKRGTGGGGGGGGRHLCFVEKRILVIIKRYLPSISRSKNRIWSVGCSVVVRCVVVTVVVHCVVVA